LPFAPGGRTVYALVNSNHKYRPSPDVGLILSPDPLAAALVAAACELAGLRPAFVSPDESPRAALRRVRPMAVLMAADDACVADATFLGPAKMTGSHLFVFGREPQLREVEDIITRFGLEALTLPRDAFEVVQRLRGAIESSPRRQESTAP
jgi:hypothetical protein